MDETTDHDRLDQADIDSRLAHWQAWLQAADQLAAEILKQRQGKPLDLEQLWDEMRAEQEARDDRILGR